VRVIMVNVEMTVDTNKVLTIKVDLKTTNGMSKSGKSMIIASTEGNARLPGFENTMVGLNVYNVR
jgi:hypothetical protein